MPTLHLLQADALTARGWTGFDLPDGTWTLLVLQADDGPTGLDRAVASSRLLPSLFAEAHLWQPDGCEWVELGTLPIDAALRAVRTRARPAAVVVEMPSDALRSAFDALRTHHAALAKRALQRRLGRPVSDLSAHALHGLMNDDRVPSTESLQALFDGSRSVQLWQFAGEWGLVATLHGPIDRWAERLMGVGDIRVHQSARTIPVW